MFHRTFGAPGVAMLSVIGVLLPAASALAQGSGGSSAGTCLAFDGVDDLVHVTRTTLLEPETITVELWARLDGPQDWNARLLRKAGHFGNGYTLSSDRDFDERMQLIVSKNGALVQARDTQSHSAYVGAWHHFAGVYTEDQAEFWVDGLRVAQLAHSLGAIDHLPLTDLYIGAGLPSPAPQEYFAGRIDEVRIWDYPRSAQEIQAAWNHSLRGDEAGLIAYWRFDEGSGDVAHDSTVNAHDGRLGASDGPDIQDPAWMVSDVPLLPCSSSAVQFCTSTPNSSGLAAHIAFSGNLSIQEDTAFLEVFHAPAGHAGLFIYGSERYLAPLADGFLCISPFYPGLFRLPPAALIDDDGHVLRQLRFGNLPAAGQITPGSTWCFQFWFRDWAAHGTGSNLSDGLELTFCP